MIVFAVHSIWKTAKRKKKNEEKKKIEKKRHVLCTHNILIKMI